MNAARPTAATIVAVASPPGAGAIGLVRLSGPEAIGIADRFFKGKKLEEQAGNTVHFGSIISNLESRIPNCVEMQFGIRNSKFEIVDEVLVSLFRAPRSYTGEDVVEISCHGSPYILQRVLELCLAAGARLAEPGEFTQRAFLNGRMDLTQAEAVADLIASQSRAAHSAAMSQLRGGFSADLKQMRDELIHFAALIELELDFSEEDVEFADRGQLKSLLDRINASTHQLINSFRLGNAVKNGVSVAIVGAPNAGKSTLLNALLNEERAIVSDIAGTTRDTIEELLNIDGILFRFIDTAGIRAHTEDAIERQGIERSRKKAAEADVVLYLYDAAADDEGLLREALDWLESLGKPRLLLLTKSDAAGVVPEAPRDALRLSAKTGSGVEELKAALKSLIATETVQPGDTIITSTRHLQALQFIAAALDDVQQGLAAGLTGDLLSHHIRQALFHIGELTGEVQVDRDILGTIFGKFCIGK